MQVKEIAVISYPAADVKKLRDFYSSALNLQFNLPFEHDGVLLYDEAPIGSGAFGVMTQRWAEREPGSAASLFLEVDDIDGAKRELDSKGVRTEEIMDTSACRMMAFHDPEGNKAWIHQRSGKP